MTQYYKPKIVHILLIFAFVMHITIVHGLMAEHSFCDGTDSHYMASDAAAHDFDHTHNFSDHLCDSDTTPLTNHCDTCEIHQICFYDNEVILSKNMDYVPLFVPITTHDMHINTKSIFSEYNTTFPTGNTILRSYVTIALII